MQISNIQNINQLPSGDFPKKQYNEGWICTKCGRSNSPYVRVCDCYSNLTPTIPNIPNSNPDTYIPSVPQPFKPIYNKPYTGDPLSGQDTQIIC